MAPNDSAFTSSRIPNSLKEVFLKSNRGDEVLVAPEGGVASRSYSRGSWTQGPFRRWFSKRLIGSSLKPRADSSGGRNLSSPVSEATCTSDASTPTVPARTTSSSSSASTLSSASCSPPLAESPRKQVPRNFDSSNVASTPSSPRKQGGMFPRKQVGMSPRNQVGISPRKQGGVSPRKSPRKPGAMSPRKSPRKQGSVSRNHSGLSTGSPQKKKVIIPSFSPQMYLTSLMVNRGYSVDQFDTVKTAYSMETTPLQKASYHVYLIESAKHDIEHFKLLLRSGLSPNPCNIYGESLLHTLARRGSVEGLQAMLDCGSSLQVCDDYGRTPLHDALWNATPKFEVVDFILTNNPCGPSYLFSMKDVRGSTPLSYIRKEHWNEWLQFLESKKESYWPTTGDKTVPLILQEAAHSRSPPEPKEALTPQLATMVASGKMTPADARLLLEDDDDETCTTKSAYDSEEEDASESAYDSSDYDDSDICSSESSDGLLFEEIGLFLDDGASSA